VTEPTERRFAIDGVVFPTRRAVEGDVRGQVDGVVIDAFDRYHADLYAFAVALVRDRDPAEDLVAEAFARLIREVRAGRAPEQPRGWLYRVVANEVRSRGRRLATARRFLGQLLDRRVGESPEIGYVRSEIRDDLLDALQRLSPDARTAVVMAARGIAGREIAQAIGRSEAATRTLLCRARIRLREELDREVTP
jgi:RNA polymerase sigma factor (sigma-70 family)